MTIAAPDILDVAQQIRAFSSEAGNRSAISRAYYSVYHSCLEWEKTFASPGSQSGPEGGFHQQLINRLRNPAPEVRDPGLRMLSKKIAARVEALRTKRVAADYLLSAVGHGNVDAENCCAQATDVMQQISGTAAACAAPAQPQPPTDSPQLIPQGPDTPPSGGGRPALKRII